MFRPGMSSAGHLIHSVAQCTLSNTCSPALMLSLKHKQGRRWGMHDTLFLEFFAFCPQRPTPCKGSLDLFAQLLTELRFVFSVSLGMMFIFT